MGLCILRARVAEPMAVATSDRSLANDLSKRAMTDDALESTLRCEVMPSQAMAERRAVLTLLTGPRAGTTVPIPPGEFTVGRGAGSDFLIEDELLSRQHARIVTVLDRYFIEDLGSTNGTYVNGDRVRSLVPLSDGAVIHLGPRTIVRFSLRDTAEVAAVQRAYEATVRDALTGVYNRFYLDERLASEFSFAKRHKTLLSVVFIDADHFKRINDTFGHAAGDAVLRAMGAYLKRAVRIEDLVARFGGEEFVIVLRGVECEGVLIAAERIRAGIESLCIEHDGHNLAVTASLGVATLGPTRDYASVEALLKAADDALYRAKTLGRNRVVAD
jgi:diguanylate cyclase (GGDEF)-like protein